MKHYILFSLTLFALHTGVNGMKITSELNNTSNDTLNTRTRSFKERSLRDELLFAYTIQKKQLIPQDIALVILDISHRLKARDNGSYDFDFITFNKLSPLDFLYVTNHHDEAFIKIKKCFFNENGNKYIVTDDVRDYNVLPEKIRLSYPLFITTNYKDKYGNLTTTTAHYQADKYFKKAPCMIPIDCSHNAF